jgi:hypothetical protein
LPTIIVFSIFDASQIFSYAENAIYINNQTSNLKKQKQAKQGKAIIK